MHKLSPSGQGGSAALTVGPQEGRRKEALVHQAGEGNDPHHVVRVKGQATERLTAQLLWRAEGGEKGGNTNIDQLARRERNGAALSPLTSCSAHCHPRDDQVENFSAMKMI